jgi:hypothetical protein
MRIEAATPSAIRAVAEQMREQDAAEFLAVSHAESRDELVAGLVAAYGPRDDLIMACTSDRRPVAVGGLIYNRPNVATLLFFATDEFRHVALGLTRFIRCSLFPKIIAAGVHRIECVSIAGYTENHRWIRLLGLKEPTIRLRGYGKNAEDFLLFSWVGGGDCGSS